MVNAQDILSKYKGAYVVLRAKEGFKYECGHDVDILCKDITDLTRHLLLYGYGYVLLGYKIKVSYSEEHKHIDFLFQDKLDIRFDLIDSFYGFANHILKTAMEQEGIKLPQPNSDLAIRLMEYAEKDKTKHREYVKIHLNESSID